MPGWVKLYRDITSHWIWHNEKYLKWWLTIILNVNHEAKKFPVGMELYICNPGQSFRSIKEWTDMFSCSKPTTIKFFGMLKNDSMIQTEIIGKGNQRKHLLTVINWDKYQQTETENFTRKKPKTLPERNPNVPPNKNDKNDNNDFDQFWSLYDKKTGKPKCLKLWIKLSKADREAIFNHLPLYKKATPDKQFRKNPETYLRNRSWEDEIIKPTKGSNGVQKDFQQKIVEHDYKPGY
jgi:hypothetical protein